MSRVSTQPLRSRHSPLRAPGCRWCRHYPPPPPIMNLPFRYRASGAGKRISRADDTVRQCAARTRPVVAAATAALSVIFVGSFRALTRRRTAYCDAEATAPLRSSHAGNTRRAPERRPAICRRVIEVLTARSESLSYSARDASAHNGVARRSNIPDILTPPRLAGRAPAALSVQRWDFHHGLIDQTCRFRWNQDILAPISL